MLRDVSITVTDGQLASASGEGVHVKVGVSPVAYTEPLVIKGSYNAKRIQSILGLSPLADACMDSAENGAGLIYCIPVAAAVEGVVGEVKKIDAATPAGTGTMAITGKPNNRYDIRVQITKAGGFNSAVFKYSFDGGVSWSDEITMPIGGELTIQPTGLTLKFTEGVGENKFAAGDVFTATTTAPQASNESVLTALAQVRRITSTIEFVHIVGESTKALWAALATEAENFFSVYYKPVFFILEARAPAADETADQYAAALIADRKTVNSYFLQVVSARGSYKRMDGTTQNINLAEIVCGLYARASVQQSISETRTFSISDKLIRLEPVGIEEYLDLLDEADFLTLRRYEGLDGFYVTKPNMLAAENSDYQYAERVRVLCKAARLVRREALLQLHRNIDMTKVEEELAAIGGFIASPLMDMADAKEISSGSITIPAGQDILADEKLHVILRFVPVGYVREISVDLGMSNPNK